MIRVRQQSGKVIPVDDDQAVEILGDDGKLAMVIVTRKKGSIQVLVPGDPLFNGYCKMNGLLQAKVTVHGQFDGKSMGS